MRNNQRTFVFLFLLAFNTLALKGQDVIQIQPNSGTVNFDGIPDDAFWQNAQSFQLVMHAPEYGAEPGEKSRIYISYDDNYLWIGAYLEYADPANIVSTSKKRDEESQNPDAFGILLDTYNDNENALGFFTMPAGQRIDYTVANDAQMMPGPMMSKLLNYSWNTFWDVETARYEKGWTVEMRIPFSSLRFQDVDGRVQMGLLINRSISHRNEIDTYPATDPKYGRYAINKPSLAQTIELSGIKSKKPVYVSPYLSAGFEKNNELNEEETAFNHSEDKKLTGGIDLKYSLTSNLTMDLTVNTDFAQVESDDQMVNLTRYALFYPEKRMFFQERSSIFSFSLGGASTLFYSRRIGIDEDGYPVPILGGARLTGRMGKWDVGIMDMQTQKNDITPSENFGVFRLRRQVFNQNSYVGAMLTSRVTPDNFNSYSYGVDGIFRVFGDDYLSVSVAQTTDTLGNNMNGGLDNTYYRFNWERRSQEGFAYNLSYSYSGEFFDPSVGFMMKYGTQGVMLRAQYGWLPGSESKLFSYSLDMSMYQSYRVTDGQLETARYGPGFDVVLKSGWFGKFDLNYNVEGVDEEFELDDEVIVPAKRYEFISVRATIMTPVSKPLSASFMLSGGQFYDGQSFSITTEPIFNVSASVQFSGAYNYNYVEFPDRNQKMNSHVARLKVLYMYNTKLSLSGFIQYNSLSSFVASNFRLRYNPKEGNDFYLVYNEIRPTDAFFDGGIEKVAFLNQLFQVKYVHTFRL